MNTQRKPDWLKVKLNKGQSLSYTKNIIAQYALNTVCDEANCPNRIECFGKKTATFMILGRNCTRNCRFCNVTFARPETVDACEPENVANAVATLGLKYVVVTSVTRDDLKDGGSEHFAQVIGKIKEISPQTSIEVLIPDFKGSTDDLKTVGDAAPAVISHNVETVPRLYSSVCPQSNYSTSLEVLKNIKLMYPTIMSKTGIMVGLGETKEDVIQVFKDLREVGCEILTIGQYLAPSSAHYDMVEYIHPDVFKEYEDTAYEMGFTFVKSGPLVRSSYHADEALKS